MLNIYMNIELSVHACMCITIDTICIASYVASFQQQNIIIRNLGPAYYAQNFAYYAFEQCLK